MKNNLQSLTSTWFIGGLLLLLLNDFILKDLYGNWFTGKLSDFSGLLIFPLFWTALFPRFKRHIFWFTGVFFIFWKSSLSESFITGWNELGILSISRVVDLTDLIALSVLPLAYYIENRKNIRMLKIQPVIPLIIAAFSFGATSYLTTIEMDKTYTIDIPKDSLIHRINRLDSLTILKGPQNSSNYPDTVKVSFSNRVCSDNVEVQIVIAEDSEKNTTVKMIDAFHSCPEGDDDKTEITKAFEEKVIKKIKF